MALTATEAHNKRVLDAIDTVIEKATKGPATYRPLLLMYLNKAIKKGY